MFEWDEQAQRWAAMHHPFTSPQNDDPAALRRDPGQALARAYDVVLNGSEIGGGSVRIFREEMQSAVFSLLGIAARRGAAEIRLPARCFALRLSAARRHRLRPRPAGDADGRRRQHSRRHRVPEDADGCRSVDRRARPKSQRRNCASCTFACARRPPG
jgi:hypothetical protein